jgi:hypothetical protein
MWREASAIAGPATSVRFAGREYSIPVRFPGPSFVGLDAYYTDGFVIGVIAEGTSELIAERAARRIAIGEEWRFERMDGSPLVYRVTERTGDDVVIQETASGLESIRATVAGATLRIATVEIHATSEAPGVFRLDLDPPLPVPGAESSPSRSRFAISIDDHAGLVTGEATIDGATLFLAPEQPQWAVDRLVGVELSRRGKQTVLRQTIGVSGDVQRLAASLPAAPG